MKKLALAVTLMCSSMCIAQGRPEKQICLEIGEGCTEIDSPEVVELKLVFNSLVGDLDFWLDLQRDFNNAGAVNQRFNDFNNQIAVLQTVKDTVGVEAVKNLFQVKIDAATKLRNELHSTKAGSKRDEAGRAQNVIAQLNQQLNSIDAAIRDID